VYTQCTSTRTKYDNHGKFIIDLLRMSNKLARVDFVWRCRMQFVRDHIWTCKRLRSSDIHNHVTVCVIDFFPSVCHENAEEECSAFRAEPPLSEEFNSTAFEHFCR